MILSVIEFLLSGAIIRRSQMFETSRIVVCLKVFINSFCRCLLVYSTLFSFAKSHTRFLFNVMYTTKSKVWQ